MAKHRFLRATIEESQQRITQLQAAAREQNKRCVEFLGQNKVKAVMERDLVTVCWNYTDGRLLCQHGIARNPQTGWRPKGTGLPPPVRSRRGTPHQPPFQPGMPPGQTGPNQGPRTLQTGTLPAANVDSSVPPPRFQIINLHGLTEDRINIEHFDSELLNDERTSCNQYTMCCVWVLLRLILNIAAAVWTYMSVETSIDRKKQDYKCNIIYNLWIF